MTNNDQRLSSAFPAEVLAEGAWHHLGRRLTTDGKGSAPKLRLVVLFLRGDTHRLTASVAWHCRISDDEACLIKMICVLLWLKPPTESEHDHLTKQLLFFSF